MRLLAAPDKFRGTATAAEVADACRAAAEAAGWACDTTPISDGGEGFLDCLGGANRQTVVRGPLGAEVTAGWRLAGRRAVVEMAAASGLALVADNDPLAASTTGTGELIAAALAAGATEILLGVGGSATTDGGVGALAVLGDVRFDAPDGPRLIVATDVRTPFRDAARVFAPQKGATPGEIEQLTARLTALADRYRDEHGVDVTALPGAGAAGGLAGGLAALGARLRPGFDVVAEATGLRELVTGADLVVTGEGRFDETSLAGKAPASVAELAVTAGVRAVLIVGQVEPGVSAPVQLVSLAERFGSAGRRDPLGCVRTVVAELLAARG